MVPRDEDNLSQETIKDGKCVMLNHLATLTYPRLLTRQERLILADLLSGYAADILKDATGTSYPDMVTFYTVGG